MGLYLLDYGAGNVQSLANSLTSLGYSFTWVSQPSDFDKATSLIFPGVGAFETAVQGLKTRGLFEPLLAYIRSGRPYFGICIGMQVLFASSTESDSTGLGVISSPIEKFDNSDKTVPHIGWNAAETTVSDSQSSYFYFVHSYCAKYEPEKYPVLKEWAFATTQYGQESFVSIVRKGNVFGTQFHPEKSGPSGLQLLTSWLSKGSDHVELVTLKVPSTVKHGSHKLTKRIIAALDVRTNDQGDLVVTKGDQYDVREKSDTTTTGGAVRNLGKPVALSSKYYLEGADEICLLNITSFRSSPLLDQPMLAVVQAAAKTVFVPLTIGGGIKDTIDPDGTPHSALEVAGAYFRAGADKVSIGSEAVKAFEQLRDRKGIPDGKSAIETIAHVYGRQAVVVSIDPKRTFVDATSYDGPYRGEVVKGAGPDEGKAWWYQCTVSGGREMRPVSAVELAKGVEQLGAGEILLNSIDRDGTGRGFDLDLLRLVRSAVRIPVVASSGAGSPEHFVQVFRETEVEAALAAGIFHREEVLISDVKDALRTASIDVR
ncbi:hypothetical protein DL96DRAFT_1693958 [Flagelloscypha sp. PMI_526]|nr:hypothetical protein DL96DRAFT_1693958 [Flagelloscypha sp. PMI_526]